MGGINLILYAFYGMTQDNLKIEFSYDKPDGLGITPKFNYYLETDEMDEKNIKLYYRTDAVFVLSTIKKINPLNSVKIQDFLIKQYEQVNNVTEQLNEVSPIDGMNKKKAINYITKTFKVYEKLKGFFNDNAWQPINGIIGDLQKGGIPIQIENAEYYKDNNGNPTGKIWTCEIPFTNQNGRPDKLYVKITAAGAGSINDPLSRYDIIFMIS